MKRRRSYSTLSAAKPFKKPRTQPVPKSQVVVKRYVPRTPGGAIVADNHYFDTERANAFIAATATSWANCELDPDTTAMLCLFAPVIGDDIVNRTGRKVFVKNIRIRGTIGIASQTAQTTADTSPIIRIIVYQDSQTNGAQSQAEDVINSGSAALAINMSMNPANFGRFKILKDKIYRGQPVTMSGLTTAFVSPGYLIPFKMSIKVNQWVNYNATNGGTVADVIDNSFHLIAQTENNTYAPSLAYKVRTTFSP